MCITLHLRTLYCAFFICKRDLKSRRFSHNRSTYDQQKRFHPAWRKQHFSVECEPFCFCKSDTQVDLRIVATTDIHSFLTDFDYYKDAPTEKFGFTRAASLIRQARQEVKNSVLVDNGDLIQGNPIADYQAAKGYKEGKPNPAVDCLNAMHYEVGTLGNHEFNYGLDYLADAIKQAKFPIINANVVKSRYRRALFHTLCDSNQRSGR